MAPDGGLTTAPTRIAVQEERQRGKDRNENEVESTSSANEDMPVEKILEAELAVEPKTETYVDANMGLNPNSVSATPAPTASPQARQGPALLRDCWPLGGVAGWEAPAVVGHADSQHVLSGSVWPRAIAPLGFGGPVPPPGMHATGWFHLCPMWAQG